MTAKDDSKTAEGELDPELEARFSEARDDDAPSADLGALFAEVQTKIAQADKKPTFWLRSRSTAVRKGIAIATAFGVAAYAAYFLRADFDRYPPVSMALALGSMSFLVLVSVHQALRPLHRPPLSAWTRATLAGLTIAATLLLALISPSVPDPVPEHRTFVDHIRSCVIYGLSSGVPVYAIVRLLDRGSGSGALLAACAAGLLGDLALQLRCACDDVEHLLLGHFSVVLVFVGGIAAVHALLRRLR